MKDADRDLIFAALMDRARARRRMADLLLEDSRGRASLLPDVLSDWAAAANHEATHAEYLAGDFAPAHHSLGVAA